MCKPPVLLGHALPSSPSPLPPVHTLILNRITVAAEVKRGFLNAVLVKITEILDKHLQKQRSNAEYCPTSDTLAGQN